MSEFYLRRLADDLLPELLHHHPAVMITGPRATGKTTTAARLARSILHIDRPEQAAVVRADPDEAIAGLDEPVLIDEWQIAPEILGAVKRAVDAQPSRRGRYLITSSARADLDSPTWPGTGRVIRIDMYGLTPAELASAIPPTPLLDRLADGDLGLVVPPAAPMHLRGYLNTAITSGFPEPALMLAPQERPRWLDSYVDQLLTRDVLDISERRDPERMRRYFEAYALNTAGVTDQATLVAAARIARSTADAYEGLLHNLHVADALPAWWSNRLKRLTRSAKRYLVDPALATTALRLDLAGLMRDGDLVGRILDTFVVAQLRADLARCTSRPRLFHLRQADGRHEVDIIVEYGGGRVIGVEVKATSAPRSDDARHLVWLKEELGDRFLAGLVLHTGTRPFHLADKILAAPIASLWH